MPLNVCDRDGRHLGFVYKAYPLDKNVLQVALTSLSIENCTIDTKRILSFLGSVYSAKNIFGKVNEEQLDAAIENQLYETCGGDYKTLGVCNYDEFIRLLYLQYYSDWSVRAAHSEDFRSIVEVQLTKENTLGFVLLDIRNRLQVRDGAIVLDADMDYLEQETITGLPLYGRIHKYPAHRSERLHLVNNNHHLHLTTIPFISGNSEQAIELQIYVHAAKGMDIQVYLEDGEIRKVLTGGAVYLPEEF